MGQKEQEGIIKVVAVVDMVINFLITDKSIMEERSSVPSQVSKCSTTSVFSSNILVQKGQGKLGWSEDESKVSENNTLFSLQLIGPMLLISKISQQKAWPTKHIYLNKEYSLNLFRHSDTTSRVRKKGLFKFIFSYGFP